jgi:hypothetical protein
MDAACIRQFQKVRAVFRPRRTDDLHNGSAQYVGQEFTWTAAWMITEEDGGPYVGEWAMTLAYREDGAPNINFGWVPSGDLEATDQQEENPID